MSDSENHAAHQFADSVLVDPMLDSSSFNECEQTEPDQAQAENPKPMEAVETEPEDAEQSENINFPPSVVTDAQPISMVSHDEFSAYSSKKLSSGTRRNADEMAKHDWLPEDWKIDLRTRTNGATVGRIDPYYISPAGKRHRSKAEVFRTLGKEIPQKRKANSAEPSKKNKSGDKRKKADEAINAAENFDELPAPVSIEARAEEPVSVNAPQEA